MKTIICHSFPAWDTPYVKSTLELITRMAGTNRVIFLDYAYTWKDYFKNPHAPKKHLLSSASRRMSAGAGEIELYNAAPMIPANWAKSTFLFELIMKINAWIMGFTIRRIRKTVEDDKAVLINAFNPVFGHFTKKSWEGIPSIYYCYDEISGTIWSSKWGKIYEQKFASTTGQIITSSETLASKFEGKHRRIHAVKNGVNLEIFAGMKQEKTKTNKLGYIGAVDDRIDFELLAEVARSMPDFTFEMVGTLKVAIPDFCPPNILFLGSKDQRELPAFLGTWDLCLIPFVKTPLTKAIYPLKINEYLMSGKPVLTTSFTDLSEFSGLITEANEAEEFVDKIKREIKNNNRLKIQRRMNFAKDNSWEHRTQEFLRLLA
jgi:glycosyltransferase involved in cell wall biosynthesis